MIGEVLARDGRRLSPERRSPVSTGRRAAGESVTSHLPRAVDEIVELMHAKAAMITIHASSGEPPALIYADGRVSAASRDAAMQTLTHHIRHRFEDGQCFWREDVGTRGTAIFLMPIDQANGHGRLVLSVLFDRPTVAQREAAERLFHQRRPFATGFFQLWQQNRILEQRASLLESVLDRMTIGLVMLDSRGLIAFTNQTAQEILADGDGIARSNGALRAANLADGVNLHAALSHALASVSGDAAKALDRTPLLAFRRKKGPPLVAAFLPAHVAPIEQGDVAAVMYLVDPQTDMSRMLAPLCRLYALSPVETTLVCHLASGETIATTAQKMHVKEQTARGYLKTIFIKTSTKRQTELIVLMLSSAIRMKQDVLQEALTMAGSEQALQAHSSV